MFSSPMYSSQVATASFGIDSLARVQPSTWSVCRSRPLLSIIRSDTRIEEPSGNDRDTVLDLHER